MGLRKLLRKAISNCVKWADRHDAEDFSELKSSAYGFLGVSMPKRQSKKQMIGVNPANIGNENYGLNFTVYGANGGKVIQIQSYDPHTDKSTTALHIITDNENLGEELGLIITRESLTR